METGEQWSTSYDLNVGADRQKTIGVNPGNLMSQGESNARGEYTGLTGPEVNPIKPSGADASR